MTYFFSLIGLIVLCILWIIFQEWLTRQDQDYKGYQAGCRNCSQSCDAAGKTQSDSENCSSADENQQNMNFIDASKLRSKSTK